jgi:Flp pilus assembly protein TadD
MGNVLKELGRLDEARAAFLEALVLDPKNPGVYVNLADSKTFTPAIRISLPCRRSARR